jgi:hypothetical protein
MNMSLATSNDKLCWICLESEKVGDDFVNPCGCCGSVQWVHRKCLGKWLDRLLDDTRDIYRCELCHETYRRECVPPPPSATYRVYRRLRAAVIRMDLDVFVWASAILMFVDFFVHVLGIITIVPIVLLFVRIIVYSIILQLR